MIGLIIWAILVIFIVICVFPDFVPLVIAALVIAGVAAYLCECARIRRDLRELDKGEEGKGEEDKEDRERAIAEWEAKWKRRHPGRK